MAEIKLIQTLEITQCYVSFKKKSPKILLSPLKVKLMEKFPLDREKIDFGDFWMEAILYNCSRDIHVIKLIPKKYLSM